MNMLVPLFFKMLFLAFLGAIIDITGASSSTMLSDSIYMYVLMALSL